MISYGTNPESARTPGFSRNDALELLLKRLNSELWPAEERAISQHLHPNLPTILIMGPLRSGTTLLMQWLASTNIVSYPTNLLSRFYGAPVLGAEIQLLLTDPRFSFRNELGEFLQRIDFSSENGKTKGVLAPNEFWYFLRRFLATPSQDVWTDNELRQSFDGRTMLAELAGIMDVFGKPFAAKGLLFSYNIGFLNELFEKVIFVQTIRDPLPNIQSALQARERQLGSREIWYSFKIPEYEILKDLDPVSQVAGQIACINRAVSSGLAPLAEERKIVLSYESFCENPRKTFDELVEKLNSQGCNIQDEYCGVDHFDANKKLLLSQEEANLAMQVYEQYISGKA